MNEQLVAKLEIRDVIERYFHALDTCDAKLLGSCFADDAEARYHVGTAGEFGQQGGAEVVAYLVRNMDNYHRRTHAIANASIAIKDGESASSLTNAIAVLWKRERIHVRGLRYDDDLERRQGEWRIVRRRHQPLWQFDATPTSPEVPAPALEMARGGAALASGSSGSAGRG